MALFAPIAYYLSLLRLFHCSAASYQHFLVVDAPVTAEMPVEDGAPVKSGGQDLLTYQHI